MHRHLSLGLIFVSLYTVSVDGRASAQFYGNPLQTIINNQDAKIGEQRVQRQTEVLRLERILSGYDDRVTRLERQMLSMSRMPVVTIAEAEAQVALAEAELQESAELREQGQLSEVRLARDRLTLARAQGQLAAAKTAQAENELIMEMDLAYAQRALFQASNEKEQMERMVAKGYTSSDSLRYQIMDVNLAERQLELARLRLESQRNRSEPETGTQAETP